MPDVRNIPQTPALGDLAEFLKKVRQVAKDMASMTPAGKPELFIWPALEALVGKKPEIVEDLSYGFPPTKGTGEATQIKPEYAPDVADVLPQQGIATAVKGVASKLAGAKALPLAAGMFVPVAHKAEEAAKLAAASGMSPERIWQDLQVAKFPWSSSVDYYAKEIPVSKGNVSVPSLSQDWQGKVGDVLDHPELFWAVPSLADVSLTLKPTTSSSWSGRNLFKKIPATPGNPSFHSSIELNLPKNYQEENLIRGLEHEGQHHVQQTFGLPLGENYKNTIKRLEDQPHIFRPALEKIIRENRIAGNDEFADLLESQYNYVLAGKTKANWLGHHLYNSSLGEMQAYTANQRADLSDAVRRFLVPRRVHTYMNAAGEERNIVVPYEAGDIKLPVHPMIHLPK